MNRVLSVLRLSTSAKLIAEEHEQISGFALRSKLTRQIVGRENNVRGVTRADALQTTDGENDA